MKTVAIVGTHIDTRANAPYANQDVDIWVMNQAAQASWTPRYTACFQLHEEAVLQVNQYNTEHWNWLTQKHGKPVYMFEVNPKVPDSVKYPLDEIVKSLPCEPRMFSSTVAYMLALAAYLKYDKVLLYGMEMTWESEYGYQREGFTYWVGLLQGMGIIVERYCADNVFVRPLYGKENIWYQTPERWSKRLTLLNKQIVRQDKKAKSLAGAVLKYTEAIIQLGRLYGRHAEATRYEAMFREMMTKTGKAIMDTGEPERMMKVIRPQLLEARDLANQALGKNSKEAYTQAIFAMSILEGQIDENNDILKEAPK